MGSFHLLSDLKLSGCIMQNTFHLLIICFQLVVVYVSTESPYVVRVGDIFCHYS